MTQPHGKTLCKIGRKKIENGPSFGFGSYFETFCSLGFSFQVRMTSRGSFSITSCLMMASIIIQLSHYWDWVLMDTGFM